MTALGGWCLPAPAGAMLGLLIIRGSDSAIRADEGVLDSFPVFLYVFPIQLPNELHCGRAARTGGIVSILDPGRLPPSWEEAASSVQLAAWKALRFEADRRNKGAASPKVHSSSGFTQ
ncbi:hypothetical protein ABEX25_05115 [Paenibacillus thiaminolyticus]|uniref:hypothetical protein n=1 Tax=Paenibacillus thiaminolyticus TaxID=49283 RepID=UPI003D2BF24E